MSIVIIYSLPSCGYCHQAKDYLKSRHIKFKDVNVDSDPAAQAEMVSKSGQYTVPVLDIDGQIIVGYQKNAIDALILAD